MKTTPQYIIDTIRAAQLLPSSQINLGKADGLSTPYVSVSRFVSAEPLYETNGAKAVDSEFDLTILGKNADEVLYLFQSVNALVEFQNVTPNTIPISCMQKGWTVGQLAEGLYQWAVIATYELKESFAGRS